MTDTPKKTLIAMLLDRSGSMSSCKDVTEEAFNGFIVTQQEATANIGDTVTVMLSQFDTEYENVFPVTPLEKVPKLQLVPRGNTALLDAMGKVIYETDEFIAALPDAEKPDNVLLVTMTDGAENSSTEYSWEDIAELVKSHDKAGGGKFDFVFLGANQDAIKTAAAMHIQRGSTVTYAPNAQGTTGSTQSVSANTVAYRTSGGQSSTLRFSGDQRKSSMGDVAAPTMKVCTCGAATGEEHKDDCEMVAE